jgi:hypothetical protein
MERYELPLSKLSLAQKLDIMELIWDDLTKDETLYVSPKWHGDVLKHRESMAEKGTISVSDWNEAKERIRRNVSCE